MELDGIIPYEGVVIRPPSEAGSLIFQVTLGCSDNGCVFCPAYKEKRFRVRALAELEPEVRRAAAAFPDARRVFLADGDALAAGRAHLEAVCALLARYFPRLARIGAYASAKSVEPLSVDDLRSLKARKMGILYLGFETGDPEVYASIRKYGSPERNAAACRKAAAAGITTNVTVILGLGGVERSRQHAENTARCLNDARPDQIAALTLMVVEGTPLDARVKAGTFRQPDAFGELAELRTIIAGLDGFRCLFMADHASNYLPVRARLPGDREAVLAELDAALAHRDRSRLVPDALRGL